MYNKQKVIIKFKDRKLRHNVMYGRKSLKDKKEDLLRLGFQDKLYLNDSLALANQVLFFKCRQLKKYKKIYETWFYNNKINVKVTATSKTIEIFHDSDLENILQIDDLDDFLMHM